MAKKKTEKKVSSVERYKSLYNNLYVGWKVYQKDEEFETELKIHKKCAIKI